MKLRRYAFEKKLDIVRDPFLPRLRYTVRSFFRKPKNFKKNKDGVKPSELWNLDFTLAYFIYPRLKAFREAELHGCPPWLLDENGEEFFVEDVDEGVKIWKQEIQKMEEAFRLILEKPNWFQIDENDKIVEKGLKLFAHYFTDLWD